MLNQINRHSFFYVPGFQFVVKKHNKEKLYSSSIYEGAKKGDPYYVMKIPKPVPVCDDIMVEFFNKSKMPKKVGRGFCKQIQSPTVQKYSSNVRVFLE